jgi:hypothetical protein
MHPPHPSQEVNETKLIPGRIYRSLPIERFALSLEEMRGTFIEYYFNTAGYKMVRFRPAYVRIGREGFKEYPPFNPNGFISRIWQPPLPQMRKYYKVSKFTPDEVKELKRRVRGRERREAQRGLMGSFPEGRRMGTWPPEKLPAVILGLVASYL